MKSYRITGKVFGNFWGGGKGAYKSEELMGTNLKALLKKANELLKDGGLDSGMGFESLIGALLNIEETETIKVKGKEYQRKEYSTEFIGELTEEQRDFLLLWA
jgi:hypothetical protein